MKAKELSDFFLYLEKWVRQNKDKITKPIRTKHFLEDLAYIVHWLDDPKVSPTIQKWKHEDIPKHLSKIFGIKKYRLPKLNEEVKK